jgi:hypothetical protein
MATNEQEATAAADKIQALKLLCIDAWDKLDQCKADGGAIQDQIKLFDDACNKCIALFNYVESCVASSDLLGANRSEFWAQEMANTACNVLDTIPTFYERANDEADELKVPHLAPSINAYTAMQNAVSVYNPDQVKGIRKQFRSSKLPIRGFTHPAKMNTKYQNWEKVAMLVTAVCFLLLFMAIAVFKSDYNRHSFFILRTILALVGAAFAGVAIPGILQVKGKVKTFSILAIGAAAFFVVIYFFNPGELPPDTSEKTGPSSVLN